jgi:hypothetical protein
MQVQETAILSPESRIYPYSLTVVFLKTIRLSNKNRRPAGFQRRQPLLAACSAPN